MLCIIFLVVGSCVVLLFCWYVVLFMFIVIVGIVIFVIVGLLCDIFCMGFCIGEVVGGVVGVIGFGIIWLDVVLFGMV